MAILELFNFLHLVGLAWGVGGATIAAIISRKAEKDQEVGRVIMKLMPSVSKIIWLGLVLLLVSGFGISAYIERPINTWLLAVKHTVVIAIVIIGAAIWLRFRKMQRLIPKPGEVPSAEFSGSKRQVKALSAANLVLWYLVVIFSTFI